MSDASRQPSESPGAASAVSQPPAFLPATPDLLFERRGAVAWLTFNRPASRNAMTWAMYEGLYQACEHVDADDTLRVLVLKGAGDQAFVAGTDISQFTGFSTAEQALDYERGNSRWIGRLEQVRKPTIAMLRGACVGGGAALALACDLRVAADDVRFGVPIARTLGNTLSIENVGRLVALVGPSRAKDLLFTARLLDAVEGSAAGLFNRVVPADDLERQTAELATQVAANAPLTVQSLKEAMRRLAERTRDLADDDLILACYLSADFREGVSAFLEKRRPSWTGR